VVALAALVAVAGCTQGPVRPEAPIVVSGLEIGGYATHEECVDANAGDRIDYTFDSTEPVRFGLRYREGGATVFPVEHDATRGDAGVFAALLARRYCLVWEAGSAGAVLDYRVRLRGPGE
jgi:hypothetical protein